MRISRTILGALIACLFIFISISQAQAAEQILNYDTVMGVKGYHDDADTVAAIDVNDPAVPFKRALRISRAKASENSYSAAALWPSTSNVKKGDLLVATFFLRKIKAARGILDLNLTFQLTHDPFTMTLDAGTPVDTETWQKYAIPFRAIQDFPARDSSLQLRYSLSVQTLDVGGVSIVNHGQVPNVIPQSIADSFAYYYPGRGDAKAAWRTAALARIEARRKGNMTVHVVDAKGMPIQNADVSIAQSKSTFIWGTAASAISLVCNADAGDSARPCATKDQLDENPVTPADYRRLRIEFLKNFNGGSFYNDLKWTEWYDDKQLALDGIAWMKRNGLPVWRGHNLIWPSFEPKYQMPEAIINVKTKPAEVKRLIAEHFADELGTLRGQIPEWDVVNEPFSNHDIQGRIASPDVKPSKGVIGPASVAKWFQDARKADPKALLFLNDYSILENLNPTAQKYDLALVKYIQNLGAPVDGIGFQAHFGVSGPVFTDMQRVIDEFSPLVKAFSVTEFDFTTIDPKLQADITEDFMTFIFSQPKFNTFQMWGFWDGDHWLGNGPLFNYDWSLKKSGAVWQKLTQEIWRTKATGHTDKDGVLKTKAFYGQYRISVSVPGKSCNTETNFTTSGEVKVKAAC
jgi:GH35 family endo-1,4-beta-xylanase